jgi:hypothetical protein
MDELRRWLGVARSVAPQGAVAVAMVALAATTLAACASGHETGSGNDPDAGDLADVIVEPDGGFSAMPPVAIETEVPRNTIQAGQRVNAGCVLLDENGEPTERPPGVRLEITYEPMSLFAQDGNGEVIGEKVGMGSVWCAAPSIGLVDETPEPIEILPGAPHSVITQVDSDTATAGMPTGVTCLAFDAYGNEVTNFNRTIAISPSGDGTEVGSASVTATRSGMYEVSCNVTGAPELESAFLVVNPGLPASISVGLSPERDFYVENDQVTLNTQVRDQFGNRVDDATVAYSHDGGGEVATSGSQYQFLGDGTFTLTATVTSATLDERHLFAAVQVTVNTTGPDIECRRIDSPGVASDAYMINRAPGSTVQVPVHVADTFDVAAVTINGTPASLGAGGLYTANVPVQFGMNFVRVVASDGQQENTRVCVFLASDRWVAEDAFLNGALGLRLDQHAVDDGSASSPITSLNNILQAVLNSGALVEMVDEVLTASNPIHSGSCGVFACNPTVNYNAGTLSWGTVNSSLQLINGGLRLNVTIPNVRATVRACGTTCCIGGSTITVRASSLTASVDVGLRLQGGVMRASVEGDPTASINGVSLDGSGFCGFLIGLLEGTFANMVRDALQGELGSMIRNEVGPMLDELVSGLDISTLGTSFLVPTLDGTSEIELGFGISMSSLNITGTRLLLGIGTRFTPAQTAHDRDTLGVALRQGAILRDPPGTNNSRPVGLSFYEGALNQILHGLWKGGFFQGDLDMGGGTASIDARLPAIAYIDGSQARLMLGGIRATVNIAPVGEIGLTFGGIGTASVSLEGENLAFGSVTLDQLHVTFDTSISAQHQAALEDFLQEVLQSVLADAINDGLPAIPIPTFALPDDLSEFGLPGGAELGITNPQLSPTGHHYILTGGFGIR